MVCLMLMVVAVLPILGSLGKIIPEDAISSFANHPTVTVSTGRLVGIRDVTAEQRIPFNAFMGIPYAEPPVGELRFAAPVKKSNWSGVWDATEDGDVCIQGSGKNIRGSEDCLTMNVYAPKNAKNLPVMVWIHGGGFTGGESLRRVYGPDFFLNEGVIMVALNYRLGIFGFMTTQDKTVSGNWGLKDQILALQWVQENIRQFGGDPDKVTIFGESAGGASVSYLLQIPKAQGLFRSAILQSGTSENLWALTTRGRQAAFQVGYQMGIATLLSRTLMNRLRRVDADKLQSHAASVQNTAYLPNPLRGLIWAPTIEVEGPDAVFTAKSDEYVRSGAYPNKVPVMIGFTSNEAGHAHGVSESIRNALVYFDIVPSNLAPFSLTSNSSKRREAASDIRVNFYGVDSMRHQFDAVVKFVNSDQFTRGIIRHAENMVPYSSVYFYIFGYMGDAVGVNPYDGAGHAEELAYMFKNKGVWPHPLSSQDKRFRDKLVRLWANFAKTGNPTPHRDALLNNVIWPTYNSNSRPFVWLNYTLSTSTGPCEKDYDYFTSVFNKYGDGPFTTY
ncbi:unnamed protein product [Ceutorhynchus assimilis]|uniref:Carboxylic ester hydrolase n=1 Tax=Ceutorhynchus assimilis TaxID=467358 RepID=A0A9N9MTW1_9CUCU|nr:unnamed protein product [Ceutorhynchus assimilis]